MEKKISPLPCKIRVYRFGGMERWNGMMEWNGLDWTGLDWTGMHNQRGPWPTKVPGFAIATPFFFFFFFKQPWLTH